MLKTRATSVSSYFNFKDNFVFYNRTLTDDRLRNTTQMSSFDIRFPSRRAVTGRTHIFIDLYAICALIPIGCTKPNIFFMCALLDKDKICIQEK